MTREMAVKKTWRCRKCKAEHSNTRLRKCRTCGTKRPVKKRRGHMKALDIPYETYVEINGSVNCGICGRKPNPKRRHDRDHDHKTGKPRGLLCPGRMGCNRRLGRVDDTVWLDAASRYLHRAENRAWRAGL